MITEKLREIFKALEGKYPPYPGLHSITFAHDGSDAFGYRDLLHLNIRNGGVWHTLVIEDGDLDKPVDRILAEVEQTIDFMRKLEAR